MEIGDFAFCGCAALKSTCFPKIIAVLGREVLFRCPSLERVVLPAGVGLSVSDLFSSAEVVRTG